jgi:hypothetical protein
VSKVVEQPPEWQAAPESSNSVSAVQPQNSFPERHFPAPMNNLARQPSQASYSSDASQGDDTSRSLQFQINAAEAAMDAEEADPQTLAQRALFSALRGTTASGEESIASLERDAKADSSSEMSTDDLQQRDDDVIVEDEEGDIAQCLQQVNFLLHQGRSEFKDEETEAHSAGVLSSHVKSENADRPSSSSAPQKGFTIPPTPRSILNKPEQSSVFPPTTSVAVKAQHQEPRTVNISNFSLAKSSPVSSNYVMPPPAVNHNERGLAAMRKPKLVIIVCL